MKRLDARGGARGQLVIVIALVVATILVGLALVLNSGIYAENLSTRETGDGGDVAVEFHWATTEVAASMRDANGAGATEHEEVVGTFESSFGTWSDETARERASDGQFFDAELRDDPNEGWLLAQDDGGSFTSSGGDGEWTLASDVDGVAGHRMEIERGDLAGASTDEVPSLTEDTFYVDIEDESGTAWRINVFRDEEDDDVVVLGGRGDEIAGLEDWSEVEGLETVAECRADVETASVDFTELTLEGEPCPALAFGTELGGPIDIGYGNADDGGGTSRSGGSYRLLVADDTAVEGANFDDYDGEDTDSPYRAPVVFDATVELTAERSGVRHDRTTTVTAEPLAYEAED